MATVTGFTAQRMLAIEAASIVDGEIDENGHLILTRHDGTQVDAGYALVAVPDASETQKGIVELADAAETAAGTSTTKAVTPAGLYPMSVKILAENARLETDPITSYPMGMSIMAVGSGSGWTVNSGFGLVVTYRYSQYRNIQWFYGSAEDPTWKRYNYNGAWGAWRKIAYFDEIPVLNALPSSQQIVIGDVTISRSDANTLFVNDLVESSFGFKASDGNPTYIAYEAHIPGEANHRFSIGMDGKLSWGPGTTGVDTVLYRDGANKLRTNDSLVVDQDLTVTGNITAKNAARIIAYGSTSTNKSGITSKVGILRLDDIPVKAGLHYRITTNIRPYSTVGSDSYRIEFHYTTDGSTPSTSSPQLGAGAEQQSHHSMHHWTVYKPSSDQSLSILLTLHRATGTGQFNSNGENLIEIIVECLGTGVNNTGVAV